MRGWTEEAPLHGLGIASAAAWRRCPRCWCKRSAPLAVLLRGTAAGQRVVVNLGAWEIETQLGDFIDMGRSDLGARLKRA